MALLDQDLHEILEERKLLDQVAALARGCDGCPSASALDAVLRGTPLERPVLPSQRGRGRS